MREKVFNVEALIKLQQVIWYIVLVYFAVITAIYMLDIRDISDLAAYGIIFILVTTVAKLVLMAEQFRKAGLKRFWGLSYVLVVILAAVVAGKYLL